MITLLKIFVRNFFENYRKIDKNISIVKNGYKIINPSKENNKKKIKIFPKVNHLKNLISSILKKEITKINKNINNMNILKKTKISTLNPKITNGIINNEWSEKK